MIENPPTARILQISPKETITYDMPWATYTYLKDILDFRAMERSRITVEKAISILENAWKPLGLDAREGIVEKRTPTKPEIKGLAGRVWYDEFKYSEDLT